MCLFFSPSQCPRTPHRRTGGRNGAPQVRRALDLGSRRDGAARTGLARQPSAIGVFPRLGATIRKPAFRQARRNIRGDIRLPSSKWDQDALQAK
ncbi:Hypothetical protein BN69_1520 [Methylocystis sp. SC2]|nr:Hypothetical protein BN69_1520 [Methylocystis sp. SC2]